MGKDNRTVQSTQQTGFPSYIEDSQHNLADRTREYFNSNLGKGGAPLAPLTGNQTRAGSILGEMAGAGSPGNRIAGSGQVTPDAILAQMNPFLNSVGRDTIDSMRDERDNTDARIGANAASAVAFGGSGPALERAQNERSFEENTGKQINSLMAQGYSQAAAIAQANANNELTANTNAAGAASDQYNNRLNAAGSLLNFGGLEQSQNQANADRIKSLLSWYGGTLPGIGGTTTSTSPDTSPSLLQQILGGALTIGGMSVGGPAGAAGGSLLGNFLGGR